MSKYVIGNWKTNPKTKQEALALATALKDLRPSSVTVGVAPIFLHLNAVASLLEKPAAIWLGVQDITHKTAETGAFTGDVSAMQVADMGAEFTLVGHSERRQYHNENDKILTAKIRHAFAHDLSVIYCVGETKDEYERGDTEQVLTAQLALLEQFTQDITATEDTPLPKLIIAYEPVWAIGTGLTPTFDEVERVHGFIKALLSNFKIFAPILYGGSVNDKNAPEFAKSAVIDGALVGGASLKIDSFAAIVSAFDK
ncbi:MAG: triose-phosphate isomerase [Moraxella sp.]|nr:triose-phosphate isomerase [Moraxella sp.]